MSAHQTVESESRPYDPQTSFLERLADRLELGANARAVFGEPVEREGTTVIPVAKARWGMGGGSRTGRESNEVPTRPAGTGGGGATMVKPLGFIELAEGHAKFRPIRDPEMTSLTMIAFGFLGLLALGAGGAVRSTRPRPMLRFVRGLRVWRRRR